MDAVMHEAWQCPSCGRHVPRHVDTCRCGASGRPAELTEPPSVLSRWAGALIGYRRESEVPRPRRLLFKTLLILSAGLVYAGTAVLLGRGAPPLTPENVHVVSRLDDYTNRANPSVPNSIPSFVAQPGSLGILPGAVEGDLDPHGRDSPLSRAVRPLSESELQKGFCSPNVALLVRQQYPGAYDTFSNAELERMVLAKHPEYRDRLCVLPPWIDATPHDIVKYQVKSTAALTLQPGVVVWSLLVSAAFVVGLLNVYYRVFIR
jgi:hypothetical protein